DDLLVRIDAAGNTFGETNAILNRLNMNVTRMADRPDRLARYLSEFQDSISALGLFITMANEQPLLLDVLGVAGTDAEVFRPRANVFQRIWHNILAFLGSFTQDFSFRTDAPDGVDHTHIEVWVATGFDVFNIMGRIINEQFIPNHPHISVDLRLVDAGIVFPASLTGQGPDVVLTAQAAMPINFAFRAGAIDLTRFDNFDEVAARFAPAAIDTLSFRGATYALPDTMTFNMMFYRTDVFEDVGITQPPNDIQEFLSIVPPLQSRHMDVFFSTIPQPQPGSAGGMVGATTRNLNTIHIGLLHQMGGRPFADEGAYTLLADDVGIQAFRFWTDLYTKHGFIVETDVLTRFRMGELPVFVAGVDNINLLNAGAPEIRGRWNVAPIPGMYNAQGEFRRDNVLSVSCNFIVGNIAERRGTVDAAWEFITWFTSYEAQNRFTLEVESVFGHNWRHQTANLASFQNLGWGDMWPAMEETLNWAIPIPQVPGGYIAGREIHNAFANVVVDNGNPVNALLIARDRIDSELTAKRREFGLE
ncbi:MAG: extracellular solute-binding protein, partial [Firmicutes bacterium]|nr:extracellular solute-binding protein [Bacillota bacterium]